jgi:hypothetical protein
MASLLKNYVGQGLLFKSAQVMEIRILCFYETRNLIIMFGKVPRRNLYWNTFIQSTISHPVLHRSLFNSFLLATSTSNVVDSVRQHSAMYFHFPRACYDF